MDVRVEELSPLQRKITVTVDERTVAQRLDRSYATLRQEVKLPGFRKGKVPRKVLEERFGPQAAQHAATELVAELLPKALHDEGLDPVAEPAVEHRALRKGKPFEFSATVELQPAVELTDLDGLEVHLPEAEVEEQEVDGHLQAMMRQAANLVTVDGDQPADEGYVADVTLTMRSDGYPDHVLEQLRVGLPDDSSTDFVLELVRGLRAGESRTGAVEVPTRYPDPVWAGARCEATVEVKSVSRVDVPELDEAFARKMGHESVSAMKEALREALIAAKRQRAQARAERELLEQLIAKNPFEVPQSMIDSRAKVLLRAIASELVPGSAGQQPSLDDLEDDKRADLLDEAEFAVRRELLLQAVAAQERLEPAETERMARIADIAQQTGQTVDNIRRYMEGGGMKALDARIVEEKAVSLLLARASQGSD